MLIYLSINNSQQGPFSREELHAKIKDRSIDPDTTLAWSESLPDWTFLSNILRIDLLAKTAPPISPVAPITASSLAVENKVAEGVSRKFSRHVTTAAGLERIEGFSLGAFFSEVFSKHDEKTVEKSFTVGTDQTTPPIDEVDASWPRPWLFFRLLLGALLIYWLLIKGWSESANPNFLPGIMLVGSFAVPVATIVLFFEINVWRNISLYVVLKAFFLGGTMSLVGCLFIFKVTDTLGLQSLLGASVAALAEEPVKLAAAVFVMRNRSRINILNGLLLGATVGAGFAAFESAGYAFNWLFEALIANLSGKAQVNPVDIMITVIQTRGLLSPFCHIVWTAMAMAALVKVKGDRAWSSSLFFDARFLRVFAFSIGLHMLWNSGILNMLGHLGDIICGVIAWIIIISQIQAGLNEIKEQQRASTLSPAL